MKYATMASHLNLNQILLLFIHGDEDGQSDSNFFNQVLVKLKQWLLALQHLFVSLLHKFDEVFPPGTRSETIRHWLAVAAPFLIGGLVLACCCWCCCKCCCGGRGGRMMRAPGRGGRTMRRSAFEGNPGSYFRDLRAGKPLFEEIC